MENNYYRYSSFILLEDMHLSPNIAPYQINPKTDDINGDGKITAVDALLVLKAALGLITLT